MWSLSYGEGGVYFTTSIPIRLESVTAKCPIAPRFNRVGHSKIAVGKRIQQSDELMKASPRANPVVPLLHIGFVLIGIVNTLLGPILPMLSARWRLDDAGAGALFFVQSAGAISWVPRCPGCSSSGLGFCRCW